MPISCKVKMLMLAEGVKAIFDTRRFDRHVNDYCLMRPEAPTCQTCGDTGKVDNARNYNTRHPCPDCKRSNLIEAKVAEIKVSLRESLVKLRDAEIGPDLDNSEDCLVIMVVKAIRELG